MSPTMPPTLPRIRARAPRGLHRLATAAMAVATAVSLLAVAGCGGDALKGTTTTPGATGSTGTTQSPGAGGKLTVGGADFTEMLVMEQVYALALEHAGFEVTVLPVTNRENYASALESGEISVVPEYAATMAEYLNVAANGPDAKPVASGDVDATVAALRTLAEAKGLSVLNPSTAADQNAYVVTDAFAAEHNLSTLSQLGALHLPLVLAAAQECPQRPFCEPGLEQTYGLDITKVLPLGFGSLQTKQAVQNGEAQLGQVATTDGSLAQFGLKVLQDDKSLQNADNLIPVVNAAVLAAHPEITGILNAVSAALTTEILSQLDLKVDTERAKPEDVARGFLEDAGLLG